MPPMAVRINDWASVPTKPGKALKPIARRVAISIGRAATEEYIVLSAPASAPNAMGNSERPAELLDQVRYAEGLR